MSQVLFPELEETIFSLGRSNRLQSLSKLVNNTELKKLSDLIENKIASPHFIELWNYILTGLSNGNLTNSEQKKISLIKHTLKLFNENDLRNSHISNIVNSISTNLPKCSTDCLVELNNFCIENFQSNVFNNQHSCKELFPEVIGILADKEFVDFNGSMLTGRDFKKQIINTLCMLQWPVENVIVIASMFTDITLTNEEHVQVVNKIVSYLDKLTVQEIPGFVFQLLKLCHDKNCHIVILRLQNYFGTRIYDIADSARNSVSHRMDLDAIEPVYNQHLVEAESTVLYHIHSFATLSANSIKDYLLYLKNMIRIHEFILHPFQLAVLLTISIIQQYEERIFEILKSSLSKYFTEMSKREGSLWFRDILLKSTDVENNFNQVLESSLHDREGVIQGLVNFSFVLLNVKAGFSIDPIMEKGWNLATSMLVKIVRGKTGKGSSIVQEIINNILTDQNNKQYIDCLYILSRNSTMVLLENQACISDMLEHLTQVPSATSFQLLDVITPLTNVCPTIRDHLILLLRKAFYSSKTDTRQMALAGYIKLLTNLKLASGKSLSQSRYSSGHSLFTQISLNRSSQRSQSSFTNEALCLEILGVLKRCYMHDLKTKIQLYEGLYHATRRSPEIRIPVLEMLWNHFSSYYITEEATIPPLEFYKISIVKDMDVIQQESLGKLTHIIGLLLVQNDDSNEIVDKFKEVFESVCDRMIRCELFNFQLEDELNANDVSPESEQKLYVLQEAMAVYEGLIAYKINSWNINSSKSSQVLSLFQGYNKLLYYLKSNSKSKTEKRKKASSDTSVSSCKKVQKNSSCFKVPESILDIQTIIKALQLLYEPIVDWTSIQEASTVRSNKEINRHILKAANYQVGCLKNKKELDREENARNFKHILDVAVVLYNRCMRTFNSLLDYDSTSGVLAAECFHAVLNCISSSFKKHKLLFLQKVVQKENEDLIHCLKEVIAVYQKLFEIDEELENEDADIKKLQLVFVNTLTILSSWVPSETTNLSNEFCDWLHNYAKNSTLRTKSVAAPFFGMFFSFQDRYKKDISLLEEAIKSICTLIGTNKVVDMVNDDQYDAINEATVNSAYMCVTNVINSTLDQVDWVIARLKAENILLANTGDDSNSAFRRKTILLTKEKSICCQLCFVTNLLTQLSSISIKPGPLTEAFFKNITHLYSTLTNFTKYYSNISTKANPAFQGARFEKLVKNVGRMLAPSVNYLILYLEEESKKEQSVQSKAKSGSSLKSKILKDTRLIPKVTYGMEQFSSSIIQLSNKIKIDLAKHIGQGTTRDFRILVPQLTNAREDNDEDEDETLDESVQTNDESKDSESMETCDD